LDGDADSERQNLKSNHLLGNKKGGTRTLVAQARLKCGIGESRDTGNRKSGVRAAVPKWLKAQSNMVIEIANKCSGLAFVPDDWDFAAIFRWFW
jgi:hypothetical protein